MIEFVLAGNTIVAAMRSWQLLTTLCFTWSSFYDAELLYSCNLADQRTSFLGLLQKQHSLDKSYFMSFLQTDQGHNSLLVSVYILTSWAGLDSWISELAASVLTSPKQQRVLRLWHPTTSK